MKARYALIALPVLLLAACNKTKEDDDRTAKGQVLEGTIADSELPLDTVRSQPPLVKSEPKVDSTDAAEGEDAADAASLDSEQPAVESEVE
jgi:hypothetical protein